MCLVHFFLGAMVHAQGVRFANRVLYRGGGGTSRWDYFAMGYFAAGLFRMQS